MSKNLYSNLVKLILTSVIVAIIMIVAHNTNFYMKLNDPSLQSKFQNLIGTLISVMGAFLGFSITAVSILAPTLNLEIFKKFTKAGQADRLISEFTCLIWVTSVSLLGLIAVIFTFPDFMYVSLGIASFVLTLWLVTFVYSMRLFELVLHVGFKQ